jgi:hypothetical protein
LRCFGAAFGFVPLGLSALGLSALGLSALGFAEGGSLAGARDAASTPRSAPTNKRVRGRGRSDIDPTPFGNGPIDRTDHFDHFDHIDHIDHIDHLDHIDSVDSVDNVDLIGDRTATCVTISKTQSDLHPHPSDGREPRQAKPSQPSALSPPGLAPQVCHHGAERHVAARAAKDRRTWFRTSPRSEADWRLASESPLAPP